MNYIKNILKAVIVIGIALAFIMPGVATSVNIKTRPVVKFENLQSIPLTMNGGWVEQASGFWDPSRGVRYLHATDANISWAVGYDGSGGNEYKTWFTKTTDGGENWEADLVIISDGYGLGNICGIDGNTAWAAVFYNGAQDDTCGIYKTTNGGDNWVHQPPALQGSESFANNVYFWDENEGMCQGDLRDGYFEVYISNDGGSSWTRVPETNFTGDTPDPSDAGWTGCIDVTGDTVLFGTHKGYIWKSDDRGHTWTGTYTGMGPGGLNPGVNEIAFKDSNQGLAAHDNGVTYDLYTTSDGGDNWEQITPVGTAYAAGLSYIPGTDNMYISTGAVEGTSGASYSIDGGYNWTDYSEVAGIQLLSCDFVEGIIGWAGSFNADEFTGGMYRYTPPDQPEPELYCIGSLSWTDVKTGSTVTDDFKVRNIGDPGSLLDWEVTEWPQDWGTWTFTPLSGDDQKPEDGDVKVKVEIVAPDEKNSEFTGEVKVVNKDDPDDFCIIDVSLVTPKNKAYNYNFNLLKMWFERFPRSFPLFRNLLEL